MTFMLNFLGGMTWCSVAWWALFRLVDHVRARRFVLPERDEVER